jgi:hypothetical protein
MLTAIAWRREKREIGQAGIVWHLIFAMCFTVSPGVDFLPTRRMKTSALFGLHEEMGSLQPAVVALYETFYAAFFFIVGSWVATPWPLRRIDITEEHNKCNPTMERSWGITASLATNSQEAFSRSPI